MIFDPDGASLVEPLDPGILYAEIQLSTIDVAKQMIDVCGVLLKTGSAKLEGQCRGGEACSSYTIV
jgi:hypothetical protein